MKITSELMGRMKAARSQDFVGRAVDFVRDTYPDVSKRGSAEQLASLVHFAIERAELYGFVSERDIIHYLTVMLALGVHFDDDQRFKRLHLAMSGMPRTPPSVRMAFLIAMANETVEEQNVVR